MSKRIEIQEEQEQTPEEVDAIDEMSDDACQADGDSDDGGDDEIMQKLAEAEQKAEEYYDRLLRASAEFENYKKRTTREMQDITKYANEKFVKEILVVVDNLERAIASASENTGADDPLVQGVNLTLNETFKILERHKVTPIEALGKPFDPNYHQAMMQEDDDEHPPNTIIRELQKGYMIHDRLLRPSLVAVSKAGNGNN